MTVRSTEHRDPKQHFVHLSDEQHAAVGATGVLEVLDVPLVPRGVLRLDVRPGDSVTFYRLSPTGMMEDGDPQTCVVNGRLGASETPRFAVRKATDAEVEAAMLEFHRLVGDGA